MNIKAVIFDLDGVLVHTDRFHYLAWKQICDELGIPFDEVINHRLRGVSRRESLEIILSGCADRSFTEEEKDRLTEKKNAIYFSYIQKLTPGDVDPEVCDVLRRLRESGMRLAIGSCSKNAQTVLQRTGLRAFFGVVADGTMITRAKPDPQVFLLAAKLLGAPPADCLVVEDAKAGIEAAKAGGMKAVLYGQTEESEMADFVMTRLSELRAVIACEDGDM